MNKIKWAGSDMPPGFYHAVLVEVGEYNKKIAKRWHLTSSQFGIALAASGAFWLIVGIAVTARLLMAWDAWVHRDNAHGRGMRRI